MPCTVQTTELTHNALYSTNNRAHTQCPVQYNTIQLTHNALYSRDVRIPVLLLMVFATTTEFGATMSTARGADE